STANTGLSAATIGETKTRLMRLREKRVRPGLDDKRLAGWNGLMIGALARAAVIFEAPKYGVIARDTAEAVKTKLLSGGILQRRFRPAGPGQVAAPGPAAFLEDYAYLIDGLLEVKQPDTIGFAQTLADQMILRFHDPNGGFFDTSREQEQ